MWNFSQYTFREQAFSLLWSALEITRAGTRVGAEARVWVSKTVLRICCKLSLEYLRILIAAAEIIKMRSFTLEGPAGYLKNFDLRDREESGRATKKRSQQRQLQLCNEIILALLFILKHSSKWAGWSVRYREIKFVKRRLLVPNLVNCYFRHAQYDWIEYLSSDHVNKSLNF